MQQVLKIFCKFVKLNYETLDSDEFMTKIDYNLNDEVDEKNIYPFSNILNSTEYIKSIRKNNWRQ